MTIVYVSDILTALPLLSKVGRRSGVELRRLRDEVVAKSILTQLSIVASL